MKVKVVESFRYEGQEYTPGSVVDLPENTARSVIDKGYGKKLEDEIPDTGQENANEKDDDGEVLTVPVKSTGKSWISTTLFYGDPEAGEDFKKSSRVKLQKKTMKNGEVEDEDEPFYLTPTRAINLAPVLQELGMRGKLHDRKNRKE